MEAKVQPHTLHPKLSARNPKPESLNHEQKPGLDFQKRNAGGSLDDPARRAAHRGRGRVDQSIRVYSLSVIPVCLFYCPSIIPVFLFSTYCLSSIPEPLTVFLTEFRSS